MINIKESLTDYKVLIKILDEMQEKYALKIDYHTKYDGISYSDIFFNKESFLKSLIKDIKNKKYHFQGATLREANIKGKVRILYSYNIIDTVFSHFCSVLIASSISKDYSKNLYSYQKEKSFYRPIQNLAKFIRNYNKTFPNPIDRNLFILKRDFKSYTDTIPVYPTSPLWKNLTKYIDYQNDQYFMELIANVIRNEINKPINYTNYIGIPTGQHITSTLYNFYAMEIDDLLDNIPNSFYTRYSDDLIFATSDLEVFNQTLFLLNKKTNELKLKFKNEKTKDFYLTIAGKSFDKQEGFKGATKIEFLGCQVNAKGTVSLKKNKVTILLNYIKGVILRILSNENLNDLELQGKLICKTINTTIFGNNTKSQIRAIELLQKAVTDREQLNNLDYQICNIIASKLTKINGVKAFRKIPIKKIRESWGLKSLEHERNKYGTWPVD